MTLWQRTAGQRVFHRMGGTTTDGAGRFSIARRAGAVQTNREWYVTARGLRSRLVSERVQASISLTSPSTAVDAGAAASLTGTVKPSHRRAQVLIEQRVGNRWRVVSQPRLDRSSSYHATITFTQGGPQPLRVELRGDSRNVRSYSAVLTVTNLAGIHKIQHVVVIMQENRSFDQYFGTYPGADGIPPGVCVPDPVNGGCIQPFHDPSDLNYGGPHGAANAAADIDGGRMDGFVAQAEKGEGCGSDDPLCSPCTETAQANCIDVMGYHDAREIPNYWKYAEDFVLQDHMFEPNSSWSLPAASLRSLRVVGVLHERARPVLVHELAREPELDPQRQPSRHGPEVRLDRSDLPAAQGQRQLGLLRVRRHRARLRGRLGDDLRSSPAGPEDAFDLESAAPLRGRPSGQPAQRRPEPQQLLHRGQERDPPGGLLDQPERDRVGAPSGPRERRPGVCHGTGQRDHAGPRVGQHRDLPELGRLGRLLRPRAAPRRRSRTASDCASPVSSSAPTRATASSTTRSSARTPTTSSSRTTSSDLSDSIPPPTAVPIPVPTCARTTRSSEI